MALNGKALQSIMVAQLASKGMLGSKVVDFSSAFSEGLVESFLTQSVVSTVDVGLLPSGTPGLGVGKVIGVNPKLMASLALPLVSSELILGAKSMDMVNAICEAICIHFLMANIVNTTHTLVAVGTGIGKITSLNPNLMTVTIMAKMKSKQMDGKNLKGLVKGICTGFSQHMIAASIVNVVITGVPLLILGAPLPSAGVGQGKIT